MYEEDYSNSHYFCFMLFCTSKVSYMSTAFKINGVQPHPSFPIQFYRTPSTRNRYRNCILASRIPFILCLTIFSIKCYQPYVIEQSNLTDFSAPTLPTNNVSVPEHEFINMFIFWINRTMSDD